MTGEMRNHRKQILANKHPTIILLILWLCVGQAWGELSARLERDRITEGETVRLQVETDGQVSGNPDTTSLQADFEVLGISSGSRVNIINGRMNASTTWTITLSPKRSGKLTVPALEVDGQQTQPLTLQVSETPIASGAAGGSPIFIETEVDRSDPYVQGMVRYTVRLLHKVKLAEGSLSEPQPDNALVRRLGKDREYSAERDGQPYRVIERQYAIFPQASGKLELPATVLDARVADKTARRRSPMQDFFGRDPFDDPFFGGSRLGDMFTSTRPVRVRGEARILQVRPRPDQAAGRQWLPAERVALSESWQPDGRELRVGDPITRSITLRAYGVTGEQLPELEPGQVEGFKVYPDRPQVNTQDLEQTVQGEMNRSIAFVPVRPGRFTLPPVRLHWWDTESDRERLVELPEHSIQVLPAIAGKGLTATPTPVPEPLRESEPAASASPQPAAALSNGVDIGAASGPLIGAGIWPWISLLFALLWLATLGVWWRRSRRHSVTASRELAGQSGAIKADAAKSKARFQTACRANDPRQARRSLLDWATAHWPDDPPRGLDELAQRLSDPQAKQALHELDRSLYRGEAQTWEGKALVTALSRLPDAGRPMSAGNALPDLYA